MDVQFPIMDDWTGPPVAAPVLLNRPRPSSTGFWFLIFLAAAGFAPCIFVPAWKDYETLVLAARREQQINDAMRAEIRELMQKRLRIETDPAVAIRALRREMGYQLAGEQVVYLDVASVGRGVEESPPPPTLGPPAWLARVMRFLPEYDYVTVFSDAPTRRLLMGLSGGLGVVAFVLYAPKKRHSQTTG